MNVQHYYLRYINLDCYLFAKSVNTFTFPKCRFCNTIFQMSVFRKRLMKGVFSRVLNQIMSQFLTKIPIAHLYCYIIWVGTLNIDHFD